MGDDEIIVSSELPLNPLIFNFKFVLKDEGLKTGLALVLSEVFIASVNVTFPELVHSTKKA